MKKSIGLFLVVVLVVLAVGPVYADQPPGLGPVTYEVVGRNHGFWPGPDEGTLFAFNFDLQAGCATPPYYIQEAIPYTVTEIRHPKLNKLHITGTGKDVPVSVWPFTLENFETLEELCETVQETEPLFIGTVDGQFVANMPIDWMEPEWGCTVLGMESTGPWSFGGNGKVFDAEGGMHHLLFDASGVYRYPPDTCGREVIREGVKLNIN